MTEKETKKELQDSLKEYVVELKSEDILNEYELRKQEKKKRSIFNKLLIPATSLVTAGVLLAIVLPLTLGGKNPPLGTENQITDQTLLGKTLTQDRVNKLAFESTTAVQSLTSPGQIPLSMVSRKIDAADKSDIESVLPTIDLVLTNKSTFKTTLIESTNKDYSFELKVSYLDTANLEVEYVLFFNVLEKRTKVEDDEVETTVIYKGITTLDMSSFEFVAVSEIETEDDEVENEISMTMYTNSSKTSYVRIEQSSESENNVGEESFEYQVWQNNRLVKDFELETEIHKGKTEIEAEINDAEYRVKMNTEENKTIFTFTDKEISTDKVSFEKVVSLNETTGVYSVSYQEV